MKTAIVGHRGVGKTSLLARLQSYFASEGRDALYYDLDREVERRYEKTIAQIFRDDGEIKFREFEALVFQQLNQELHAHQGQVFLVCGAGFDSALIPESWHVLWLRRPSDSSGRIFTDRPRLNENTSAYSEFMERHAVRDLAFSQRADETLILNEGLELEDPAERAFFLDEIQSLGGVLTLSARGVRKADFQSWCERRIKWGVDYFELRDDLLLQDEIQLALQHLPREKVLLSYRERKHLATTRELVQAADYAFDWPIEFGACDIARPRVLSLHERRSGDSVSKTLSRFAEMADLGGALCKAAIPVHDFEELKEGHLWWSEKPQERVFLPMSSDGRWAWYRLWQELHTDLAPLGFFREGDGSAFDQPILLDRIRLRMLKKNLAKPAGHFAAVLGDPVQHSRTPIEQRDFFAEQGAPVFAIRVQKVEWQSGALDFLRDLGLRWAAVTSPLKELAFVTATIHVDFITRQLQSANTLAWSENESAWAALNTDVTGFRNAVAKVDPDLLKEVAVWGGGGVLSSIKMVFPRAQFFSVRTGENRDANGVKASDFVPQTLIWAAPRSMQESTPEVHEPPKSWRPQAVIDVNYAENSPAREYALRIRAVYMSGIEMFRFQAKAQRDFWQDE